MEEQGSPRTRSCLSQHLRRQNTQRETGVDDLVGQSFCSESAPLDDRAEPDLLCIADAVGQCGEGIAVVWIRRVNDMSGRTKFIREGQAPVRKPNA